MTTLSHSAPFSLLTSKTERSAWDITTPDGADRRFRRDIFEQLPDSFAMSLAKRYRITYVDQGLRAANCELRELNDGLQKGFSHTALSLAADDYDLREYAKLKAGHCHRLRVGKPPDLAYESLSRYVLTAGMVPPVPDDKKIFVSGAVARMCDDLWWRQTLRKGIARQIEAQAIKLGLVHRYAGIYASDEAVTRHRQKKKRNRELLESHTVVNELGDEYTLQELADLSVSNPKIRRGELMTRISGFEKASKVLDHVAVLYTLTCPSKMHARYFRSGDPVPNYDGTTPKEANRYLGKVWERIRSKLDRLHIRLYGFRVCEPMHDGTPHTHFLLFMDTAHTATVREVFLHYALQEDGDEDGAIDCRFKAVDIDPEKGSAAGYIAKYIAKNIDGFGLDCDLYGHEAVSSAERVSAWAATWGIRQFQQFGGPPVGVWRELRRMNEQEPGIIEDARQAADKGEYADFLDVMGGPLLRRKDLPIQLAKAPCDKLGRYGEPVGDQIVGVMAGNITALSPRHDWVITKRPASGKEGLERNCTQGRVAETVPEPTLEGTVPVPGSFRTVPGSFGTFSESFRTVSGGSAPRSRTFPGGSGPVPELFQAVPPQFRSGSAPVTELFREASEPGYVRKIIRREPHPTSATQVSYKNFKKKNKRPEE